MVLDGFIGSEKGGQEYAQYIDAALCMLAMPLLDTTYGYGTVKKAAVQHALPCWDLPDLVADSDLVVS